MQRGRRHSFLNPLIKFAQIGELILAARRIARQINSKNYDVAFVNGCMFLQTPPILRYLTKPTVYFCDEPTRRFYEPHIYRPYLEAARPLAKRILYGPSDFIMKRLEQANMVFPTALAALSCYSGEVIYRLFGRHPSVVFLGVDAETFRSVAPREPGLVLSVGRVAPHKAYDFLIRSLAEVTPTPRLVIACDAADPDEKAYLHSLADYLSVDLQIRERISEKELVDLYSRATVAAFASLLEPFGLAPLESMACQTPVVAVKEAGFRESVVHGETGFLTERSTAAFADALATLLGDPQLVEKMGRKARAHVVANWSWDSSARALEALFLEVASSKPRP